MVDMITPNFSKSEMACRCGCGTYEMDDEFMRMLQELRNEMNGPLRVTSARRCDRHNDAVSTAKNKKFQDAVNSGIIRIVLSVI